jgi:hypothetical protein
MSHLTNALRVTTVAALMGGFAYLGSVTATADPNSDTLAGSLSKGYTTSNCTPQDAPTGTLAAISCGQNADSKGPVKAMYLLYNNGTDLASSFTSNLKDESLTNCGDAQSPTVWHQGSATTNAGQVACGTYQGAAEIIWTTDAKNVLSYIRAANADVPALYEWWRTNG